MPRKVVFWLSVFLIFGRAAAAADEVVLYKFSSYQSSGDWVEIKNQSNQVQDLAGYRVEDSAGHGREGFSCLLEPGGIYYLSLNNYLNRDGDAVVLKKDGQTIDCVSYGDSLCPNQQEADLPSPAASQAAILADSGWQLTGDLSVVDNSSCLTPTPTPAPTNLPTLTPTASPSPSLSPTPTSAPKAVCHLLGAKDETGQAINNAKIYIDGQYIHHYLPETLNFCPDCYCDPDHQVACSLGSHQIKIHHDGYQDWQWTGNFAAGTDCQQQPILRHLIPPSPTSSPSSSPVPSLTPLPLVLTDASDEAVLGSESGEVKGAQVSSPSIHQRKVGASLALPLLFIGAGVTMIGSYFILTKKEKEEIEEDW